MITASRLAFLVWKGPKPHAGSMTEPPWHARGTASDAARPRALVNACAAFRDIDSELEG